MMRFEEYGKFDALGLADLVRRGEVTPLELLEAAIARTRAVDHEINAVGYKLFDLAHKQVSQGLPSGLFRGVPFLLKDCGVALAGTETLMGCALFKGNIAKHDSEIVARYKRAGLVIFGKTNAPELEFSTSTESLLFGATRNPWNTFYSAGGSSGGSAAAVAAGIVPAACASDGGGSIRIPAAHCGVFGLKPTRGRLPVGPDEGEQRGGLAVTHVVSRSVRDSAALLDVTAGPDAGAPYLAPPQARPYIEELTAPIRTLRIALVTVPFIEAPVAPVSVAAACDAARLLETMGHIVEHVTFQPQVREWASARGKIVCGYLLTKLEDRARAIGRPLRSDDLEPHVYERIMASTPRTATDYVRSLELIHAVGRSVARFFERYDLLVTPATASPPRRLPVVDLNMRNVEAINSLMLPDHCFLSLFNCAGTPAASIPWTQTPDGLPLGVQLVTPFGDEATLFQVAARIEEARPWMTQRPSLNCISQEAANAVQRVDVRNEDNCT